MKATTARSDKIQKGYIGLRASLFICLVLVAALPSAMLGVAQSRRWKAVEVEQTNREALSAAQALALAIGQLIDMHVRGVEVLGGEVEARGTLDPKTLQPLVSRQRTLFDRLSFMYVADAAARSIASDPPFGGDGKPTAGVDYSDRDYYKEMIRTGKTVISRVQMGKRSGVPNVQIAAPIRRADGKLLGFAEGSVDLTEIRSLADQIAPASSELQVSVLDKEGRVLTHPNELFRIEMRNLSRFSLYRPASGLNGEIRTDRDEGGVPVRAAVASIPTGELNWTVVVSRPQSVIEKHQVVAQRQTLLIVGGSFLAALSLSVFLAAWLAWPIRKLSRLTASVGREKFTWPSTEPSLWAPREVRVLHIAVSDMVSQLRDYTEELEARVEERTSALRETNRELEAFVYSASHDLKSPVVSLHGMASILMERYGENLDEQGKHYLRRILSNADFMEQLIADLLEFSRVGRIGTKSALIRTEPLVREVLEQCDEAVRARGVDVRVDSPLPDVVFDPTQLKQIFLNLIGNGIKFMGGQPAPRVEIGGRETEDWVELYVKDNGIGIAPEYHDRIFGIFQRLKEVEVEGSGVGLAIVKKIIDLSAGKIRLESKPGEGTTFIFNIPKKGGGRPSEIVSEK